MLHPGQRDRNYWTLRLRTHEWSERQLVSLLDINGVGKATIRALWKCGVRTVRILLDADAEALARELRQHRIGQSPDVIRRWQREAAAMWAERESARVAGSGESRPPTTAGPVRLQVEEARCPECHMVSYRVKGHTDARCPECGGVLG